MRKPPGAQLFRMSIGQFVESGVCLDGTLGLRPILRKVRLLAVRTRTTGLVNVPITSPATVAAPAPSSAMRTGKFRSLKGRLISDCVMMFGGSPQKLVQLHWVN